MLTVDAKTENVEKITQYANEILEEAGCPMKVQFQIDIAIDEVFSNIALYAYQGKEGGTADFDIKVEKSTVTLVFSDSGIPYNPLENDEPDVTLSADDRKIGGLGIYMVRKSMDKVLYSFDNGHNVLTLVKSW